MSFDSYEQLNKIYQTKLKFICIFSLNGIKKLKNILFGKGLWQPNVILDFTCLRVAAQEFETSLGYLAKLCFNKKSN